MEIAENLKDFLIQNYEIFNENNVVIGSVDLSRYEQNNLCVIIPETTQLEETDLTGYTQKTRFTISMLFRNAKHNVLISTMEETANAFFKIILSDYSLGGSVTDIEPGDIKYFYDCGTVEKQATGLDIELTIIENKELED